VIGDTMVRFGVSGKSEVHGRSNYSHTESSLFNYNEEKRKDDPGINHQERGEGNLDAVDFVLEHLRAEARTRQGQRETKKKGRIKNRDEICRGRKALIIPTRLFLKNHKKRPTG